MAGQRQKAPELLSFQRGGRGRQLAVAVPAIRRVPPMPTAPTGVVWGKRPRAAWRAFWKSHVSAAVDLNADAEQLRHWVMSIQDRATLLDQIREEGHVQPGRGGTTVAHPGLAYVKHLDRELARFAEHFGLTPLSRFRLQITYGEAGQAEDKLTRLQERRERERQAEPAPTGARVIDLE